MCVGREPGEGAEAGTICSVGRLALRLTQTYWSLCTLKSPPFLSAPLFKSSICVESMQRSLALSRFLSFIFLTCVLLIAILFVIVLLLLEFQDESTSFRDDAKLMASFFHPNILHNLTKTLSFGTQMKIF